MKEYGPMHRMLESRNTFRSPKLSKKQMVPDFIENKLPRRMQPFEPAVIPSTASLCIVEDATNFKPEMYDIFGTFELFHPLHFGQQRRLFQLMILILCFPDFDKVS